MKTDKGSIFLINDDKSLSEMIETPYEAESLLQQLLDEYPSLIAGEQVDSSNPRKWLTISREMGVPSKENGGSQWYIDHLFIDQDATPTFIEVKRSTDTRIRREVVGQMLDYAANASIYWSIETIKDCYNNANHDPQNKLITFLEESNSLFSTIDDFWEAVNNNLQDGRIRLLFVADTIPRELFRIIEFLNDQMTKSEVLGVEIKQFTDGRLKTLVSRVLGQSEQIKKKQQKRLWNTESLVNDVKSRFGDEASEAYQDLIEKLEACECRLAFGSGLNEGSVFPVHDGIKGKSDYFIYSIRTKGSIQIQFQNIQNREAFINRNDFIELKEYIESKLNVSFSDEDLNKRPPLNWIDTIKTEEQRQALIDIQLWINSKVKQFDNNQD